MIYYSLHCIHAMFTKILSNMLTNRNNLYTILHILVLVFYMWRHTVIVCITKYAYLTIHQSAPLFSIWHTFSIQSCLFNWFKSCLFNRFKSWLFNWFDKATCERKLRELPQQWKKTRNTRLQLRHWNSCGCDENIIINSATVQIQFQVQGY